MRLMMRYLITLFSLVFATTFAGVDTGKLELYVRKGCPYCTRVTQFMKRAGVEIKIVDISASKKLQDELIRRAGKRQVPCLFIDGKPMHESLAIVQWISKNLVDSK